MRSRIPLLLLVMIGACVFSGCASTVQPWQRGYLADYTMRADRDVLYVNMNEHIFFSREASTGGRGVGGGGCGCN